MSFSLLDIGLINNINIYNVAIITWFFKNDDFLIQSQQDIPLDKSFIMIKKYADQMNSNDIDVSAPKSWMKGWEGVYTAEDKSDDDAICSFYAHPTVQFLESLMRRKNGMAPKGDILEIACGSGKDSCFLANLGYDVTAFDALPNAIELAKRRAYLMGVENKVSFSIDNMLSYQIAKESYDVIIAIQCLQYLFEDTMPKIREILDGIKSGGYFVYSGNILPHFDTDPPIKFVTKKELLTELDGWTIHSISEEKRQLKPGDVRGFVAVVAQKKA